MPSVRVGCDHLTGGLDTVQRRKVEVHHDDIGLKLLGELNHLWSICGLAHHLQGGLGGQHHAEAISEHRVIIGDQHPNHISVQRFSGHRFGAHRLFAHRFVASSSRGWGALEGVDVVA